VTAESGEQALEVLRHQRFDVVTLDLMMPGLGGAETFRKIREMDSDVEIVVVSSAENSLADLAQILPDEPLDWVSKPFDSATLLRAVERAAERSRGDRSRARQLQALTVRKADASERRDIAEKDHDLRQILSHDLNNRLNVVLGFVHLLREGNMDSSHAARALDAIEGCAHEAVTFAVNFLQAEEAVGGSLQLHKTPASLNEIVTRVIEDETPGARLRRVDLQADLDSSLPSIDLDVATVSHALTNLLNNAIRHSPEGAVVRLETRCFETDIIVRVSDRGPGAPADEIARLFERHDRTTSSASRNAMGEGLYLVRTIIEAHGGSVSATFPPDGGSAFVIVLHCAPLSGDPNA
jgi:signal transduction histidine kinase